MIRTFIILAVIIGFVIFVYTTRHSHVFSTTLTPIVTRTPSSSPIPTQKPTLSSWQPYIRGQNITNVGIAINYPPGWTVKFKNETGGNYPPDMAVYRIDFDFLPPGEKVKAQPIDWIGWGELNIDVSDKSNNINQWIRDNLPEFQKDLIVSQTHIGNKPAYYVTAKPTSPKAVGWISRYVILGSTYSYVLGFSQNGETGFKTRLENEIYSTISFN